MMRTISVASFLLLIAVPSWGLTFGTGCANPCGVEEIVASGTATCTIVVEADASADESVVVDDVHYLVHHADGDETVAASGTPTTLMPGQRGEFPATVAADSADTGRLVVTAIGNLVAVYPDGGRIPFDESFPDAMTIVPTSTCSITTTTEMTTTTSVTTTTVQTVLGFPRMKVCSHNGQPKKCP